MGMMKNYLIKLLEQCSEEKFGQDAVEWAVASGLVQLTYDMERDVRQTMLRYDEIIEAYRHSLTAQAKGAPSKPRAPMKAAAPHHRAKAVGSQGALRRRNAA